MHVLQELLGSVPVRKFFDHHFTRAPFAMPDQAALYVQDFSDADFAAMVEDPRSMLRIVRDGRLVRDRARLSWAEAQAYYRGGHTLLVRHAERASAKLQTLAEAFARVFHAPVDIQSHRGVSLGRAGVHAGGLTKRDTDGEVCNAHDSCLVDCRKLGVLAYWRPRKRLRSYGIINFLGICAEAAGAVER
jgi:hypothetical protein